MARDLTSGMVTEVTADSLAPIFLVKLEFDSGDLNLWTGIGEITYSGSLTAALGTYTGAGDLLALSPMQETQGLVATGVTGTLSGIPSETIAIALDEPYMGRPVTIWLAALDTSGAIIETPIPVFAGLIDTMPMEDSGETATIQVTAENRLIRLETANVSRYTPEDQATRFPGDTGLRFVASLNDGREIVWGGGR